MFAGFMAYVRAWHGEKYALTFGGGAIDNPGRYLVLLPPINGATAAPARRTSPRTPAIRSRHGTRN